MQTTNATGTGPTRADGRSTTWALPEGDASSGGARPRQWSGGPHVAEQGSTAEPASAPQPPQEQADHGSDEPAAAHGHKDEVHRQSEDSRQDRGQEKAQGMAQDEAQDKAQDKRTVRGHRGAPVAANPAAPDAPGHAEDHAGQDTAGGAGDLSPRADEVTRVAVEGDSPDT